MKEKGFSSTFILVPRQTETQAETHKDIMVWYPSLKQNWLKIQSLIFFSLLTLNFFCSAISFVFCTEHTGQSMSHQATLAGFYCLCLYLVTQAGGTGLLPWLGRPGPSWAGQQSQEFCDLWKNRMGLTPHLLARTADRAVRNLGYFMEKAEITPLPWRSRRKIVAPNQSKIFAVVFPRAWGALHLPSHRAAWML